MLAYVFPGQGSQFPGMGRALAEGSAVARETFEQADAALGFGLAALCCDGSAAELARTENAQPAILATGIAAYRALVAETGFQPLVVAGHSLGEFTAHVCAGTLDFGTALRLVRRRGRLMQEAVPPGAGTMLAVMGLSADEVDEICVTAAQSDVVAVANYNGAGQLVLAGATAAVGRARELAEQRGALTRELEVSAPFHCALMAPAAARFRGEAAGIEIGRPRVPVADCASGAWHRDAVDLPGRLSAQICAPVRWDAVMAGLVRRGVRYVVEVGPGARLTSMLRRAEKSVRTVHYGAPSDAAAVSELLAEHPWLRTELGSWHYGDGGELYSPERAEIVWAGADVPEPITEDSWVAGADGVRLHRYGPMAALTAEGTLRTFDPAEWRPREDGAYVRTDRSAVVSPAGSESFDSAEWVTAAAGAVRSADGRRVIWPDGDEWEFATP